MTCSTSTNVPSLLYSVSAFFALGPRHFISPVHSPSLRPLDDQITGLAHNRSRKSCNLSPCLHLKDFPSSMPSAVLFVAECGFSRKDTFDGFWSTVNPRGEVHSMWKVNVALKCDGNNNEGRDDSSLEPHERKSRVRKCDVCVCLV